MEKKKKKTLYLPDDLSIGILQRLPVKSLIRFKCLRKSWFSLISHDIDFANSHFQLTAAKHTRRLMFLSNSNPKTLSLDFDSEASSFGYDTVTELPSPNFMKPQSDYFNQMVSSCRGFIFSHRRSSYNLWNPSTGVHKQIPLSPLDSNLDAKRSRFLLYGFGYDQSTDDYLVVSVSADTSLDIMFSRLEIFSLRNNTWKELEVTRTTYRIVTNQPKVGLFFNGCIHWLAHRPDRFMDVIIAFDLIERKLFYMPFPDCFDYEPRDWCLWVFGESLSLCATEYVRRRVEIWVMKEYKVHSSWTVHLVLPIDDISTTFFSPICSTKSGDIVSTDGRTGLLKYNDKKQLIEHYTFCDGRLQIRKYNDNEQLIEHYYYCHGRLPIRSKVIVYTESLFSLPGDNVQV